MRLVRIRFGSAAGVLGEVVERRPDGLFVIALPDPWRSEWIYGPSHLEEVEAA